MLKNKQKRFILNQKTHTVFAFSLLPQFDSVILTAFNLNFVSELGKSSCRWFTPVFIRVTPALHTTAANRRAAHIQYSNQVSILRRSGLAGSQVVSCAFQKMTSPHIESVQGPVLTAGVNKVRGLYRNHSISVSICPFGIFWTVQPFKTKPGMVVHNHELESVTKQMAFYLQGKGHSERSHNWNMTVSFVSFELQLLLQPNLIW